MTPNPVPARVGLVGAGNNSKLHLEAVARHADQTQIVALCDPDVATAQRRAAEFGVARAFASVEEMLAVAPLDAAIVCTPTPLRTPVVAPLLRAGVPVLCEKPFAETLQEAAQLAQLSRETGVALAVNQNFRRHFGFHIGRERLGSGELGQPRHLVQVALHDRRDAGWRVQRPRYLMAVMSVHWFDAFRFLLRQEAVSVDCRGVRSQALEGGGDTAISALIQFDGGTIVSLSESFSSFNGSHLCALDCENGGLRFGPEAVEETRPGTATQRHVNSFDKHEATYFPLWDLIGASREGRAPETSAADNLGTMRIMEAAYRSLDEKRAVTLAEVEARA